MKKRPFLVSLAALASLVAVLLIVRANGFRGQQRANALESTDLIEREPMC